MNTKIYLGNINKKKNKIKLGSIFHVLFYIYGVVIIVASIISGFDNLNTNKILMFLVGICILIYAETMRK